MAKQLNGCIKWFAVGIMLLIPYTATIVWGVRLEGKTKINETKIEGVAGDIGEIKESINKILEKL